MPSAAATVHGSQSRLLRCRRALLTDAHPQMRSAQRLPPSRSAHPRCRAGASADPFADNARAAYGLERACQPAGRSSRARDRGCDANVSVIVAPSNADAPSASRTPRSRMPRYPYACRPPTRAPARGSCRPACRGSDPPRCRRANLMAGRRIRGEVDCHRLGQAEVEHLCAHVAGQTPGRALAARCWPASDRDGRCPSRARPRAPRRPGAQSRAPRRSARPALEAIGQRRPFDQFEHQRADPFGFFQPVNRADVRMIERGEQARFAREAGAAFRIGGEVRRQDLDRHVATELAVARAIDLAHAASAERGDDPCTVRAPASIIVSAIAAAGVRGSGRCRTRTRAATPLPAAAPRPRCTLPIRNAARSSARAASARVQVRDPVALPSSIGPDPVRFRADLATRVALSGAAVRLRANSRMNQFFAYFESRSRSGRIFSTSAASSTLKPPKKRSSTTWPFVRTRGQRLSASSIAMTSSGVRWRPRFWSNVTRWSAPPRFWFLAALAKSTSTRRISRAATAKKCARSCHCTRRISTSRR